MKMATNLEYIEVKAVKPLENYLLEITFSSGEHRLFDMRPYLDKGIFKELKDFSYFKQASISYGTVKWPHEQDISPMTLYLKSINNSD
jgi:hypothetical protein